ncbi:MAG: type II toxin-antitoxin system HicB family antitoxin [Alphaproteobacteria bacterium]
MSSYIALIRKEPDSDYGVEFPDFPGCATAGKTLDEAYRFAAEALALHVKGMREDNEGLPEPSSDSDILALAESKGAILAWIQAPPLDDPTVRINITLSSRTLEKIDRYISDHGIRNRSAFLVSAAEKEVSGKDAA